VGPRLGLAPKARQRTRALLLTVVGAAVLLTPLVPVLDFTDGQTAVGVVLTDGGRYTYAYVNSIYGAPVEEQHVRTGDQLRITSVRSADIRAVEYFRWDSRIAREGEWYQQSAPPNASYRLTIRITPPYHQVLSGPGWTVDLAERFGDGIVEVAPTRLSILLVLLRGVRP
jgi:hypothetical protein